MCGKFRTDKTRVDVTFGDLTLLVGPQASGKSLFLELFKYVIVNVGKIQLHSKTNEQ